MPTDRPNSWMCVTIPILIYAAVHAGIFMVLRSERWVPRNSIPAHLLGHAVVIDRHLLSPSTGAELLALVESIGLEKGYPTNVADLDFYVTSREHIGEATPVKKLSDGSICCENPFLVPSRDRTQCILAGRIDIGRHLILTGGAHGLRESYDSLVSRVQSFGAYHFNLSQYPLVEGLFSDPTFQEKAQSVCPMAKQYLDPFQFNFILQVPGQTVAAHLDGVYFWGASRFQFPQWLLAAMQFSGLFHDAFVDQVQVVGYLHRWKPVPPDSPGASTGASSSSPSTSGDFLYWSDRDAAPRRVPPRPLSGTLVDGSKTVHAAGVYRMGQGPTLPFIDRMRPHRLSISKRDSVSDNVTSSTSSMTSVWVIEDIDEGRSLQSYDTDDLRISIVYRARCFVDRTEAERFRAQLHGPDGIGGRLGLDSILNTFVADLVRRGDLPPHSTLASVPRLDLALRIMDTYVKYPLPAQPLVPWNYCALGRLVPSLDRILSVVC